MLAIDEQTYGARTLWLLEEYLDLAEVRATLAGYPVGLLDAMEREYRRFLALRLMYPDVELVPGALVDEIWHRHSLDAAAYRADCERVFGRLLARNVEDPQALEDVFATTLDLYRTAFGAPPPGLWASQGPARSRPVRGG